MTNDEIKAFIAEKVSEGISLSKIQDALLSEKGVRMTYMELRMLASEIETADWQKLDKQKAAETPQPPSPPAPAEENALDDEAENEFIPDEEQPDGNPEEPAKMRGKTTVELSKLVKPGTVANGSVKFGSGATADWFLDQMGRLALANAVGKPDQTDIEEFQQELQKLFAGN